MVVVWIVGGVIFGLFFSRSSNVKLNRIVWPLHILLIGLLFIGFIYWIGLRGGILYTIFIPGTVLISILNIYLIKFCDNCAKKVNGRNPFAKVTHCPKCGHEQKNTISTFSWTGLRPTAERGRQILNMNSNTLKLSQWTLGIICLVSALTFILVVMAVAPGEKLSQEQMNMSAVVWGVFGVSLMGSVGLKAYRDYVQSKAGKFVTFLQVIISLVVMVVASYLAWSIYGSLEI